MLLDNMPHECKIIFYRHAKDEVGGTRRVPITARTGIKCWEQSTGSNKTDEYQKSGLTNTRKVYFSERPGVTTRHKIIITKRNGVAVPESDRVTLDIIGSPQPDVSTGRGILYKVICKYPTQESSA